MPSRFNVAADLPDGRKAVFNTFSTCLATVNAATWRGFLEAGAEYSPRGRRPGRTARLLHGKNFLVARDVDELDVLRLHYEMSRCSEDSLTVYIAPTLACNLRCSYCFVRPDRSLQPLKSMDRRTEDAVVRYLAREARGKKKVSISWYGGEPTLGLRTIRRVSSMLVPAFEKAGVDCSMGLLTNGVLLNRKTWGVLRRSHVGYVQVTVDFPRALKRDRRGRDSLERALDGAACAAGQANVEVRVNISRDRETEFDALYEGLLRRGLQKKLKALVFSKVTRQECGPALSRRGFLQARDYVRLTARERAKAASLGLPMETLSLRPPSACTSTRRTGMVIGPDGLLYKCPVDLGIRDRAYGSVFESDVKLGNVLPWLAYDWFQHEECRRCPVLPQCAGGCPHRRLLQAHYLTREEFCHWYLRGDLVNRVREYALMNESAQASARGRSDDPRLEFHG